jgi:1,4-dihydroxy-2-naphthoate octaprenyltransferase
MIQIGTNFANDVFDYEKGTDDARRIGPVRAVQAGLLSPRQMKLGMVVAFALATLAGVYLTSIAGWVIVAIGLVSIASGIAYTGGPFPLGYHGLGDVFVMVFFGFVATVGTVFVETGAVSSLAWLAAIPVGALATNVLVVNNVRDRKTDVTTGKRTLAVRFGRTFGVAEYIMLLVVSYGAIFAAVALGWATWVALLGVITAPVGARLAKILAVTDHGPSLNRLLASSAKLMLSTSAFFAIGIAAGRYL